MSYKLIYEASNDALPVCQKSWGSGSIGFGCKDCEADPQCIICPECFFNGDHESHRVRLIHTSGGCCDCGDPSSWKSSGFCSLHRGVTAEEEHQISIRPELLTACIEVGEFLVTEINTGDPKSISETLADLSARCQTSREFLAAVREGALEISRLERLVHILNSSKHPLQQEFSDFFLSLMQLSPVFKETFGRVFARHYSECMRNLVLSTLTVQIFTIPTVAEVLVEEEGLLDTVVTNLLQSVTAHGNRGFFGASEISVGVSFWRVIHDFKYLMQHRKLLEKFVDSPAVLRFVECVRKIHHGNFQTRIPSTQDHVEFENSAWKSAFKYEELMLDSILAPCLSAEESVKRKLFRALGERIPRQPQLRASETGGTLHVPLVRMLVLLGTVPSDGEFVGEFLGERILEDCGGALRMSREIEEGLWVRNGQTTMEIQNRIYKSGIFNTEISKITYFRLDVAGIRMGLQILGLTRGLRKCTEILNLHPQVIYEAVIGNSCEIGNFCPETLVIQAVGGRVVESFAEVVSLAPENAKESEIEANFRRFVEKTPAGGLALNKEGWRRFDVFNTETWKSQDQKVTALEEAARHLEFLKFPVRPIPPIFVGEMRGERMEFLERWLEISVFVSDKAEVWLYGLALLQSLRAGGFLSEISEKNALTQWRAKPSLAGNAVLRKFAEQVLLAGDKCEDRKSHVGDRKSEMAARQAKLAAAMRNRQAAFVKETGTDGQEESEISEDERICMVCREPGTLGFACYILRASEGGQISSCGHEFDSVCWRRLQAQTQQDPMQTRVLNFQESEMRCPVCRSLVNALVVGGSEISLEPFTENKETSEIFLAKAAVKDIEISMQAEPAKILSWGGYPPVFARILRILPGNGEEISDPKLALVLGGRERLRERIGNLLGRAVNCGMEEFLVFSCWVSIALEENRWSDGERNSVAFISDVSADRRISVLLSLLGLSQRLAETPLAAPVLRRESEICGMKFPGTILQAIKEVLQKKCGRCKSLPEEPAQCLTCSEIFCVGCPKCRTSELTGHAKKCGNFSGRGIFLLPFSASVALVTPRRSGLWEAPFVDSRGETDQGLRRTVRLTLDERRAVKLQLMVARGTLDMEIVREVDKSGRYVPALL